MKRIALLLIICLTAMGSWAQQDTLVYHPFVEQGSGMTLCWVPA